MIAVGRYEERFNDDCLSLRWDPADAGDPHVLAWWEERHTHEVREAITDFQWKWKFVVEDYVARVLTDSEIDAWSKSDPRLAAVSNDPIYDRQRSENVKGIVRRFSWAYGHVHGLTDAIRPSELKSCARCGLSFAEHACPNNYIQRLGVDQIDICNPCLTSALQFGAGQRDDANAQEVADFARDICHAVGRIVSQRVGYMEPSTLLGLTTNERLRVLEILALRPSPSAIKATHGSWLGALIAAGVLPDGTRPTARGIQSISSCGHICLSLGERTICDLLHRAKIDHEREIQYPDSKMRCDWKIGHTHVEFLGLAGQPEYDAKTERKRVLADRLGLSLLTIAPAELANLPKLGDRLQSLVDNPIPTITT